MLSMGLSLSFAAVRRGGAPTATGISAGTQQADGDMPITVTDLSESSTAFWVLVPNGAVAPSQAEVLAGQASGGGAPSDSGSFSATTGGGPYEVAVTTGLDGSYDLYVVFQDAGGNNSPVYSATAITIDTTAPVISGVSVASGDTQLSVDWSTNTAEGTARIVAVPNGSTAPTAAEILAGTASGGGAASADSGAIAVSVSGVQTTVALTGLTNGTAYDVYIAHKDAVSNAGIASDLNNTPAAAASTLAYTFLDHQADAIAATSHSFNFDLSSVAAGDKLLILIGDDQSGITTITLAGNSLGAPLIDGTGGVNRTRHSYYVYTMPSAGGASDTLAFTTSNSTVSDVAIIRLENAVVDDTGVVTFVGATYPVNVSAAPTAATNIMLAVAMGDSNVPSFTWGGGLTETYDDTTTGDTLSIASASNVPVSAFTGNVSPDSPTGSERGHAAIFALSEAP